MPCLGPIRMMKNLELPAKFKIKIQAQAAALWGCGSFVLFFLICTSWDSGFRISIVKNISEKINRDLEILDKLRWDDVFMEVAAMVLHSQHHTVSNECIKNEHEYARTTETLLDLLLCAYWTFSTRRELIQTHFDQHRDHVRNRARASSKLRGP